ncbi:WecB/TagA/CpsF family glycosyltransferase [Actinoplanes sp. NPDC051859]|uniref:WecB/TagA/CpsF family glycosyltransferase n=1 Tax=Actinoplanes sp. NPDC051859 TaxID=3363909 RepID=UPI0037A9AAE6
MQADQRDNTGLDDTGLDDTGLDDTGLDDTGRVHARYDLFGVPVDALSLGEAVAVCMAAVDRGELLEVGAVNAAKIVKMGRDPDLRAAVLGCDLIVADGQSVVWASRLLRRRLPERVAGIDLFQRLLYLAEVQDRSVYFLGARPEVLETMMERLRAQHPALRIAGSYHGYYADDETPAVADAIKASGADLLFLGMTSPKKEVFVSTYGARTGAKVVHGVGGSFDVLAGVVKRAPLLWQRMGCEWLYRVLQEPRRLGGRYLTTNVAFIRLVAREWARSGRSTTN